MQRKLAAAVFFLCILTGCAKSYKAHPGAVDNFDSRTYDTLTIVQAGLDEAKQQFALGKLPASSKTVINDAGGAYNLLRDAWLGYRAVKTANPADPATEYVAKINALLPEVSRFIDDLTKLLGHRPKAQLQPFFPVPPSCDFLRVFYTTAGTTAASFTLECSANGIHWWPARADGMCYAVDGGL